MPGYARSFRLSNGDVVLLYRGLKWSAVDEACREITAVALRRTKMIGPNPYTGEETLYSIIELLSNVNTVIESLERSMDGPAPTLH